MGMSKKYMMLETMPSNRVRGNVSMMGLEINMVA